MAHHALADLSHQALKQAYDVRYDGDYMEADAYSTWVHDGLAAQRVRQTLQQIPGEVSQALDYGCGQGKWIPLLQDVFRGADITGIDISAVAVQKAAGKYPQGRFMAFDGERAPLPDCGFDLVFSFHVLEHVLDIDASVRDMARLIRPGGYACIIFPCGNAGSFEHRFVSQLQDGCRTTATGERIFFFEKDEGHLRRIESETTIAKFEEHGLVLQSEFYSGQRFASLDWLIRGTGPHYIKGLFHGVTPKNQYVAVKLRLMRQLLLSLNRLHGYRKLDLTRRRSAPKQLLARLVVKSARVLDNRLTVLAHREWERDRHHKGGSVQYLVFRKPA